MTRPVETVQSKMLLAAALSIALATVPAAEPNVIFLTWDGVRWQDFFDQGADAPFGVFWKKHAAQAAIADLEAKNGPVKSLPAYQEMMVGAATPCDGNRCGRVEQETLVDRLVALGWSRKLAVVGSWGTLEHAISKQPRAFVDVGRHDGEPLPPWGDARKDADTWAKALKALEAKPRFLWISLNDADEWGHRGSRVSYASQLRRYDLWLDALLTQLAAMPGYGENTTVVVTTDHGRGEGESWTEHGDDHPAARRVFALALGRGVAPGRTNGADHRGLRGTLEKLLGLAPKTPPIAALVAAP
jgi:Type I phosphodiesterase / nucleotide pyrophosphatase